VKLTQEQRGYGVRRKNLRKKLQRVVEAGEAICARCGLPIQPWDPFDLDHDDHDRSRYLGASHVRCNRSTAHRRPRRWSRRWWLLSTILSRITSVLVAPVKSATCCSPLHR